jgi:hypothetical protein
MKVTTGSDKTTIGLVHLYAHIQFKTTVRVDVPAPTAGHTSPPRAQRS